MPTDTLTRGRLRALAQVRPAQGRVLSLFLNLDPAEFATAPARATAVSSLLTEAEHRIQDAGDVERSEREALKQDLARAREVLERSDIAADGTQGLAVYTSTAADLLEVVRLPHPVESRVVVERTPYVEPLMSLSGEQRWCVLLTNRRTARLFAGTPDGLEETDRISDQVHRQHSQGGWSQSNYQRSVDKDVEDHLKHAADVAFLAFKHQPFDALLVGAPEETLGDLKARLHPYLRERIRGRVHIDVEHANDDKVRTAARSAISDYRRARERDLLDRLSSGLGRGERAVGGLEGVLAALNEARVDVLLVADGLHVPGACDPDTGMLAAEPGTSPTGSRLEPVGDVVEEALQKAVEQSTKVVIVRYHDDLGQHGGIAALLRF